MKTLLDITGKTFLTGAVLSVLTAFGMDVHRAVTGVSVAADPKALLGALLGGATLFALIGAAMVFLAQEMEAP